MRKYTKLNFTKLSVYLEDFLFIFSFLNIFFKKKQNIK